MLGSEHAQMVESINGIVAMTNLKGVACELWIHGLQIELGTIETCVHQKSGTVCGTS